MIESLPFPPSIAADVVAIPPDLLPIIARKHVDYLNNRISQIEHLSNYLRAIDSSDLRKSFYITKVKSTLHDENVDLPTYVDWYRKEYFHVRINVDKLCDRILDDDALFRSELSLLDYWKEFSRWNEIDNFHGMFLTSGRWDVNFMMPVLKKIIEIIACHICALNLSQLDCAQLTEYLITPQYAEKTTFDPNVVSQISSYLVKILTGYDKAFLFLAHAKEAAAARSFASLEDLAIDAVKHASRWCDLLNAGIFPAFAWHEFQQTAGSRRSQTDLVTAQQLCPSLSATKREALMNALELLGIFKNLELNYHVYNYKGRFGLLSKYMYIKTAGFLSPAARTLFWEHILLDAFTDAYRILDAEFREKSKGHDEKNP